ncbi:MAG: hypothetical protein V3U79_04965 [Dehalococcoidia bacterium]
MVTNQELRLLFERAGLPPSQKHLDLVSPVFQGFLQQLEDLHSLDLEGEEVQSGFMPQDPEG